MNRSLSQKIIFFPNTCQDFGRSHILSSSQILYPVKKFCVLLNLTLYLVKSPDSENNLPDKCWFDQPRGSVNHMEGNMAKDSYSDVYSIFWSSHSTVPLQPFILNTKPFPASGLIWFANIANFTKRALSIQPKILEILVGTSNWIDHFGLVWPEYLGPLVVHFDWSGHFGRSNQKVSLTKLLSPVPLFCFLLTRTITKRMVAWVGSVQLECTIPLGTWNFRNFKPDFSHSYFQFLCQSRISWGFWVTDRLPLP